MKIRGILFLIIVTALIVAGWYFAKSNPPPQNEQAAAVATAENANTVNGVYTSSRFHFSLVLPQDMVAKEYDEGEGSGTVVFEDASKEHVFQVFITPYEDTQITPERFKLDTPSGVRTDEQEITIDGVKAVAFFSEHSLLGETREVWFINRGFLYEVTTYKSLDDWLSQIMTTWKFTPAP